MEMTIFSKKRKTAEGREFSTYFTELLNKNSGELEKISVKFREECGAPKVFPCNIVVEKENCNISKRTYEDEEGLKKETRDLWITAWTEGSAYVDHSTDEYF